MPSAAVLLCQVTKSLQCYVRVTILASPDGVRSEEFKVMGVAVVPYTDTPSLTLIDNIVLASNMSIVADPAQLMAQAQGDTQVAWAGDSIPVGARMTDTEAVG